MADGNWQPSNELATAIAGTVMQYLVALLHERPPDEVLIVGTGMLVSVRERAPSRLLTATHVVKELAEETAFITGANIDPPVFPVNAIAFDDELATDVALLELRLDPESDLGKSVFVPSEWTPRRATRGAHIVSVGFPHLAVRRRGSNDPMNEIRLHVLFGTVTSFDHEPSMTACESGDVYVLDQHMAVTLVSAAAFGGASGGPVFECTGEDASTQPRSLRLCGVHQGVAPEGSDPSSWSIRANPLYKLRMAE